MRKNYTKATAELVTYEAKDIITLSLVVGAFDPSQEDGATLEDLLG